MATINKFYCFVQDLAYGNHVLKTAGGHTLKVCLTDNAPVLTWTGYSNITGEPATEFGYTQGGAAVTVTTSGQTTGTYKLIITDPTWTASGGAIDQFQYAILYNDSATGKPLIAYWDYGSKVNLASGESFTVDFNGTNGVFSIA